MNISSLRCAAKVLVVLVCTAILPPGCKKTSVDAPVQHFSYYQILDTLHIPLGKTCHFKSMSDDTVIFNADSTVTEMFYGNAGTVTRHIICDAVYSTSGYESNVTPSTKPIFRCMMRSVDTANISRYSFVGYLADSLTWAHNDDLDSTMHYYTQGNIVIALYNY